MEVSTAPDSFNNVQEPETTANTAVFGGPLSADTVSYQDPTIREDNYIDFTDGDYSMIDMEMTREEASLATFSFTYQDVQNRGYEGVLHIYLPDDIPVPPTGVEPYNHTIRVTVFGNEVYHGISGMDTFTTIHFSFFHFAEVPANGFGTVQIEYSSDYEGDAIPVNMQFGLIDHENVINEQGECATECVNVDGYTTGLNYNTVPPTCIQCDTSFNIEFAAPNGTCSCVENFVQVDAFCVNCEIPLCADCSAGMDYCFQCVDNADYINENSKMLGCECIEGFYRDDIECLECAPGCVDCNSANACTACVDNDDTRLEPSENCACKEGFFENGNPICGTCNSECLTCEGTAENCVTCDTEGNFKKSGTTCICEDGFALVIDSNDGSASCVPCDETCATCQTFQPEFCLTCRDDDFRELVAGGICKCIEDYFEIDGKCVDTTCQSIDPDCQSCAIILGTGQPICRSCASELRVLSRNNLTCECKIGYFEEDGECLPCGEGCEDCDSATVCNKCAISARDNFDGTCECPTSYFIEESLGKLFCQPCSPACLECEGTADTCSNCAQGFVLEDDACVCPDGTYLSPDGASCRPCSPGCAFCSGPTCDTCQDGFILNEGSCTLDCPIGTYNAGVECRQCSDFCRSCVSSISCRSCTPGHYLFAGSCRSSCPAGTFAMSNICIACQEPCATCSGNAFTCNSCVEGYILFNNQCLTDCPAGYFHNGEICEPCSTNCASCQNSAGNCITCPSNKFLVNGQCFDTCPYVIGEDGKCTDNCPSGFYLNGQTCAPCQGSCKTCSAAYTCLSCVGDLFAYNGQCLGSCPAGTLTIGSSCADCHESCVGCTRSPVECVRCANGYYRLKEKCVASCPEGTFLEASTGFCRQCDSGCKACSGPGNCLVCEDGTENPTNQCGNTCGANCLICEDDVCRKCAEGTISTGGSCSTYCPSGSRPVNGICVCSSGFLHNNNCVASCPEGYLGLDGECKACSSPCATCSGTVDKCVTCQNGFTIEQATGKCVTSQPCPYGRYRSMFGDCRHICAVGTYYNDFACFDGGCPIGYVVDEENRACIKQTIDTGCTIPKYLQGTRCVLNCEPGFYPDPSTRVCKPCSANCYACSNENECTSCDEGFAPSENGCVSTGSCSAGLVKHNGNCLASCPSGYRNSNGFCLRQCANGYFYWNNGCYETCPTGLHTESACVIVCPVGTVKNGNSCNAPSVTCGAGQFYNTVIGQCDICRFPCAECQGTSSTCTDCTNGFALSQTSCVRKVNCPAGQYQSGTGCVRCPERCATCSDADTCLSCSSGFIVVGNDCERNTNQLQQVSLQVLEKSKRDLTVFIKLQATILPNNLPTNIASNLLLLVPEDNSGSPIIANWIQGGHIYAAITYTGAIPNNKIYLIMNSALVGEIFKNIGYTTSNAFVEETITPNLPLAPASLVIPPTASNSASIDRQDALDGKSKSLNFALQNSLAAAVRDY